MSNRRLGRIGLNMYVYTRDLDGTLNLMMGIPYVTTVDGAQSELKALLIDKFGKKGGRKAFKWLNKNGLTYSPARLQTGKPEQLEPSGGFEGRPEFIESI